MEAVSSEEYFEFNLFHKLSQRWSVFVGNVLLSSFDLVHVEPEIDALENLVKLRIRKKVAHWGKEETRLQHTNISF